MFRVLFVCLGNICRSPAAEGIFRSFLAREGLDCFVEVDSAGTSGYHNGDRPDPRMHQYCLERGYDLTSRSRQFDPQKDFDRFNLILTMDESNYRNVIKTASTQEEKEKVQPMVRFCKIHDVTHVPDPYYDGEEGFRLVIDILEDSCHELIKHIKNIVSVK